MKKILQLSGHFIILMGLLSLCSCKKDKLKATVPAYLHINSFTLSTDYAVQGSNSSKIIDVWLYVDGQSYGTYPLPATIPININGTADLDIRPGIEADGISAMRRVYPFYTYVLDTINLEPNKDYTISPKISYYSSTKFLWTEDFEQAGIDFDYVSTSTTNFSKVPQPNAFEGSFSGHAEITEAYPFVEAHSPAISTINPLSQTYLELNYKCDHTFQIGFYHDQLIPDDQVSIVTLKPKSTWNKVYISMTDDLSDYPYSIVYIYIGAKLGSGETDGNIYLDNIKLVQAG